VAINIGIISLLVIHKEFFEQRNTTKAHPTIETTTQIADVSKIS
jgi:hypothetical protein